MAHISFSAQPPVRRLTISKLLNPLELGFSLLYTGESDSHPADLAWLLRGPKLIRDVKIQCELKSAGYP